MRPRNPASGGVQAAGSDEEDAASGGGAEHDGRRGGGGCMARSSAPVRHRSRCSENTCGLLPIGGACDGVWTHGLRWNLTGEALRFGGLVSSSNHMEAHPESGRLEVEVETTHALIWTTVLRPEGWPSVDT